MCTFGRVNLFKFIEEEGLMSLHTTATSCVCYACTLAFVIISNWLKRCTIWSTSSYPTVTGVLLSRPMRGGPYAVGASAEIVRTQKSAKTSIHAKLLITQPLQADSCASSCSFVITFFSSQ